MTTLPGSFPSEQTAFPGPYRTPSDLPSGRWHVMANGRIFQLNITAVSGRTVTANSTSGGIVDATWHASEGKLTFIRVTSIKQLYTGYLMHFDDADTLWRMAGDFGDITVGTQAGWYATLPRS